MAAISYQLLPKEHLDAAIAIELAGFHPDEAASLESFTYRQANAPDLFLGAYDGPPSPSTLIGYVVSTLADAEKLTHESMSKHVAHGSSVCVHSVCIRLEWRRRGIALGLLNEYISRLQTGVKEQGKGYKRVLLICHDELIELYRRAGFTLVGKSDVAHGPREWWEMRYNLGGSVAGEGQSNSIPSDILAAALSKPSASKSSTHAIRVSGEFPSIEDMVIDDIKTSGSQFNKYKLVCPRKECGSLILLPQVAKLVEAASVQLDSPSDPPPAHLLPPLAPIPETTSWWLITPSPMQFENIGFSKPLAAPGSDAPQMKMLSCAECDLGPLGWSLVGGQEFWLACSRVAYLVPDN